MDVLLTSPVSFRSLDLCLYVLLYVYREAENYNIEEKETRSEEVKGLRFI
jgi:hypothetical protein